jgi:hypothetical protein
LWASLGITTNPWTGTDRKIIATLRQGMGDAPLVTDSPLTTREARSSFISLADGVEEGYAAIYAQSEPRQIVVYALRFAATERPFYPPGTPSNHRFEIGPFDAVVSGAGGQCSQAVEAYLKSLGK